MENAEIQHITGLDGWLQRLADFQFPVFPGTVNNLSLLSEDDVQKSVDRFCGSILFDPGAVIAILRQANKPRKGLNTNVSTVENAAMMIGINRMRTLLQDYPVVNLPGQSKAEKGYLKIVSRSYHAAYQAYDMAITRGDMVPKEIFVATFLHDIATMALWLNGSQQMQAVHDLKWDKMVPDDEAQYVVLGFTQEQLGRRLADTWMLPEMVRECLRPEDASSPRAMTVKLACQLVHLSETGWYTEEMVECLESIAELTDMSFHETVKRTHRNAIEVAHETGLYGAKPSALLLPMTSAEWPGVGGQKREADEGRHFCLMPQKPVYEQALKSLVGCIKNKASINDTILAAMQGLHDGLGLNRVVFAMPTKDRTRLQGRYFKGADSDPTFSQFAVDIDLSRGDLFTQLIQKSRCIWVNQGNRDKTWHKIPAKFKTLIQTDEFFAMSIFVKGKPIGVFYADRHLQDSHLDETSYQRFKKICTLVTKSINQVVK